MRRIVYAFTATLLLAGTIVLQTVHTSAQSVILDEDVNKDTVESTFGQNKKHYVGTYIGYGAVVGDLEGTPVLELKPNRSRYFDAGLYYKRKFGEVYSATGELGYRLNVFAFEPPEAGDNIDPRIQREKMVYSRLHINNVHVGVFNRINYGKRGNKTGNYISFGMSSDLGYRSKTKEKFETLGGANFKSYKETRYDLAYVRQMFYNAEVRLGFNALVITGAYRLNDMLTKAPGYQLPKAVIGVRVDLASF